MAYREEMVKKRVSVANVLISLAAYFLALTVGGLLFILTIRFASFSILIPVGLLYLAYKLTSRMKKEFEYIVTDDMIDIDVIMNRSKRKRLMEFNLSQTEIIAPVKSEEYARFARQSFSKKIDASAGNKEKMYFAVVEKNGKNIVYFEPSHNMLAELQRYARSKIHIQE